MKHPFFTGRNVERLPGQDPEFDAFLSYRVNADLAHVELLYNLLTARGVRVWWDKVCLEAGVGHCNLTHNTSLTMYFNNTITLHTIPH